MADQGHSPGDLPRGNGVLHVAPASQPSPQAPLTTTTQAPRVLQHVPFPDKLDLKDNSSRYQDWLLFKQIWQNYEISSQLVHHSSATRTATLLTCFQPSALKVYNSLSFVEEADKTDIDVVLSKMSEFCKGVVNETYERYLFNTRSQAANEGIDVYYAALLRIAENCKFGDLEQSLVKDRIVVGVRDPALRKRLLYEKKLTLQKCLEMARSFEATNARLQSMSGAALSDADVNFVHKGKGRRRQKPKPKHSPSSGADAAPWKAGSPSGATSGRHDRDSRCYYCGRQNHPRKDCPASESVCRKCNRRGHYQVVCKSKSVREISEYSEDEGFLGVVDGGTKQWFTTVKVDGKPIEFRVDTGADVDVISEQVYQQFLRHKAVQPARKILKGADKKPLSVIGFVKCVLTKGDKSVQTDLYVIAGASSLLGCASSMILGVVSMVAGIDCKDQYPELFTGLGEMPDDYSISLEETDEPFSVAYPRKDSPPLDGQGQGRAQQTRRARSHPTNHRTDGLVHADRRRAQSKL